MEKIMKTLSLKQIKSKDQKTKDGLKYCNVWLVIISIFFVCSLYTYLEYIPLSGQ